MNWVGIRDYDGDPPSATDPNKQMQFNLAHIGLEACDHHIKHATHLSLKKSYTLKEQTSWLLCKPQCRHSELFVLHYI